ncbi:aminomethyl-transferring glycine dehydrogenase subunit GcvPA [Sinanaerobacter sp. ZZT-01]|uniref:aminomethyl-transferring glycine dehydrogenase subunit GcvPA n=1 Tax=Sinanaerobacter sp. ZZT-01 TaxID=3111540 RepID=UPI002D782758|nr:aminomethyl-transferring glycine dehydrogenase subunit GcvPA [Sinanaerobacter sp. ZZT-01]WRR94414.1 aminomethyl-transferring glycine dehydrogenase subunit GcvPA [Sinanaerobacter sp. ZZT-01]
MASYVPSTIKEREEMLKACGVESVDAFFEQIPYELKRKEPLNLPEGQSEMEVSLTMQELASKNRIFKHVFLGAGAYRHYIPAQVKYITAKEEFLTAYTPYQAEISQGLLQSIFEYQTMICELTGMDVSNASVYDGATASAEAVAMCKERKRATAFISESVDPKTLQVIRTYCEANGMAVRMLPLKDGKTDLDILKEELNEEAACVLLQQPNFFGLFEDAEQIGSIVHEKGAKFIMNVNPIALGLMKTPAECGADIAVGEGQPLGIPLSFGGPYLGFMAAKNSLMRKLPGRIVGETVDVDGKRAFVLTLQAREQHIRREKASSNICSNQALCAMTASVYLSVLGSRGLAEVAEQCFSKAHYALERLLEINGFEQKHKGEFFHEFVTVSEVSADKLLSELEKYDILGGLALSEHEILWCVTEKNRKKDIDYLIHAIKEVCEKCS